MVRGVPSSNAEWLIAINSQKQAAAIAGVQSELAEQNRILSAQNNVGYELAQHQKKKEQIKREIFELGRDIDKFNYRYVETHPWFSFGRITWFLEEINRLSLLASDYADMERLDELRNKLDPIHEGIETWLIANVPEFISQRTSLTETHVKYLGNVEGNINDSNQDISILFQLLPDVKRRDLFNYDKRRKQARLGGKQESANVFSFFFILAALFFAWWSIAPSTVLLIIVSVCSFCAMSQLSGCFPAKIIPSPELEGYIESKSNRVIYDEMYKTLSVSLRASNNPNGRAGYPQDLYYANDLNSESLGEIIKQQIHYREGLEVMIENFAPDSIKMMLQNIQSQNVDQGIREYICMNQSE